MFIRKTVSKNKNTGKVYTKHQLVESVRTDSGPRQKIVMDLGYLDIDESLFKPLAKCLAIKLSNTDTLINFDEEIELLSNKLIGHYDFIKSSSKDLQTIDESADYKQVDLNSVDTINSSFYGLEEIVITYLKRLNIESVLKSCGLKDKQVKLAIATIAARAVFPASENKTLYYLNEKSSIREILSMDRIKKDAFYEIADVLFYLKDKIEKQILAFNPTDSTIFLYDITNTYFEGSYKSSDLAKFGKSKEKRTDAKLVSLSLIIDSKGKIIKSNILEGNISEPMTLKDLLDDLESYDRSLFNDITPTLVMDRGIATKENLELITKRNYPYIVIQRSYQKDQYSAEFNDLSSFETIQEGIKVKKVGNDLLVRSEDKLERESSINNLKIEKFKADIERLNKLINSNRLKDLDKANIALGRVLSRHNKVTKFYTTKITKTKVTLKNDTKYIATGVEMVDNNTRNTDLEGCYIITSSDIDKTPKDIFKSYTSLTRVENAFRLLKSDLGLRPIFHQKDLRIKGHLFISTLAYTVVNAIETDLIKSDDTRSYSTIANIFSNRMRATISLIDNNQEIYHIRTNTVATPEQNEILDTLNIKELLKRTKITIGHL